MKKKVRSGFIVLLVIVLVGVAGWLSIGLGGDLLGDYRSLKFIKTTQGVAINISQYDPHVTKVEQEYKDLLSRATNNNKIEGIYERIHAGDYAYETLTAKEKGQYTIEAAIFFGDKNEAQTTFDEALKTFKEIGYTVKSDAENTEQVELVRQFIPADESSSAAPGFDKILISIKTDETKPSIRFNYQSTELPLGGIPAQGDTYTVEQVNKMWEEIGNGKLDLCSYEPNGAIGGWYPEYECLKELL